MSTPTPTLTPTLPGPPRLDLLASAGRPGGQACLHAVLATNGAAVSATANDVSYDPALIAWATCTIHPQIGPLSPANKSLMTTPLSSSVQRLEVSGPNPTGLGDSSLFACRLSIAGTATIGNLLLGNTAHAYDAMGTLVPDTAGDYGSISVTTCGVDCDGDGMAEIGELIHCVNAYLGSALCDPESPQQSCPIADANGDGSVSLSEVAECASHFLNGC